MSPDTIRRADGRVEWVCEHGVGHTIAIPYGVEEKHRETWFSHTCDGCCSEHPAMGERK